MAGAKKRSKPYRARWSPANAKLKTMPWRVSAVFNPMLAIIDQLEEHGTIDVAGSGQPVFKYTDGDWYDSPAAIMGFVEAYEIHEVRSDRTINLEPLRQLANKLKYSMPIFPSDTAAARDSLARCKAETLEMTAGYADQLVTDFKIKDELQKEVA